MFLIDDILLAPVRGFVAICEKIQDAAQQELEGREKAILAELCKLHQQLETGGISDEDFNAREAVLLDHLDAVHSAGNRSASGS